MSFNPERQESQKYERFSSLFFHYAKGLVAYAVDFGLNRQEAEDIAHDVFVNLWEKMEAINPDTVRSYLFQSIRNGCLNYISRVKKRTVYQDDIPENSGGPANEDIYIYSELRSHLEKVVDGLPPQQKKIYTMARRDNKTIAQIALSLELSPRTVEKHIELASMKIRRAFSQFLMLFFTL